jgi:hypothetical protein
MPGWRKRRMDIFGVSLSRVHHGEQHRIGIRAFNEKYRIDLWALAAELLVRSKGGGWE